MKTIEDKCIELIRKISKIHAAKCNKTTSVNIAEQSSKILSELTGEIKSNFEKLDERFLNKMKEKIKGYQETHPIIHEPEIGK